MKKLLLIIIGSIFCFIALLPQAVFAQPGALDTAFNRGFTKGAVTKDGVSIISFSHALWASALQPDGKILVAGDFSIYNGVARSRIARLNADGSLDENFNPGTGTTGLTYINGSKINAVALQPDGKIIIAGQFDAYGGAPRNSLARLNADGSLDNSFVPDIPPMLDTISQLPYAIIYTVAVKADGKIIVGGVFSYSGNPNDREFVIQYNADGSRDDGFNANIAGTNRPMAYVSKLLVQPDNKILVLGVEADQFGTNSFIYRLNTDGTEDNTFATRISGSFYKDAALQADGKIVITGTFNGYCTYPCNPTPSSIYNIVRVNADGTLDNSFAPPNFETTPVNSVAIQPDGKIIAGCFLDVNNNGVGFKKYATRLNTDGTLDASFDGGSAGENESSLTLSVLIQPDGKVLVAGQFDIISNEHHIVRLNSNGSLDNGAGFNSFDGVTSMALQADGKIITAGNFTSYNSVPRNQILRLMDDGSLDESYNPGALFHPLITISGLLKQADDKIITLGGTTYAVPEYQNRIARINTDGSLDNSFNTGLGAHFIGNLIGQEGYGAIPNCALQQPDGKILVAGNFTGFNNTAINQIARLNTDGSIDGSFNPGAGIVQSTVYPEIKSMALLPDGKIMIAGSFNNYNGTSCNSIALLNSDGSIDAGFNSGTGPMILSQLSQIISILLQPDGKIFIAGDFTEYNGTPAFGMARINQDGSIDPTFTLSPVVPFGTSGLQHLIYTMTLQSDGKIIIGGFFNHLQNLGPSLARLNADGSVDNTFNTGTSFQRPFGELGFLTSSLLQTDGKLLVAGSFTDYNGNSVDNIARIFTAPCTTIFTPSVIIAETPSGSICAGTSVIFTATPTNGGTTPNYQWRKNNVNVGINSATYTDASLMNGDIITCKLTSSLPCALPDSAISNAVTTALTPAVTPSVSISLTTGSLPVCSGNPGSLTFTATPVNGGSSPAYQWKINGSNVGNNSPVFTYGNPINGGDIVSCVLTSNVACASPTTVDSNGITVTIVNPSTWYLDADQDAYHIGTPVSSCTQPGPEYVLFTAGSGDCDDNNPAVHPFASEVQGNNVDDNCDGETDELPYCVPTITFPCSFDGINEVVLGSITNNTNGAPCINGYSNYTLSHSTTNAAGNAVNFSFALRGFSLQQVNVYVDYTNDGDFDDAGEAVAVGVEGFEGAPATGSFVIPAAQPVGNYRVRVISSSSFQFTLDACNSNSGEAEDYRLTVTPFAKPPYCTPVIDFPCVYTWMQDVTLGTIVNTNTSCNGGYSDFSSLSTDVLPGGNVDFSINCFGGINQFANIYVDFTDDGDFDDAGEQVATNFFIAANTTANGLFTVPAPLPGGNYRLRIVMDEESSPSPTACHTAYGEAEDYTLHVLPVYCTPVIDNPCSNSYIAIVIIGAINNTTACTGYDDYSATQSTTAAQGAMVNFSVSSSFFTGQNASIYIDYNSDGDFDDAGEQAVANLFMDYMTPATGTFQIPPTQAPGSYRMRVISDFAGNTQPCNSVYGEVEDYTLIVEDACPVNTWTSAANDGDWNNPANWCSGEVPTGAGNAKIPAANTPYPSLTADASVNNIVIESGATLSIDAHTLTLNGTVNEATFGFGGTISGSDQSGLIALNNAATYIYFTPGQNVLKNLTLGYAAQLFVNSGDLEITANPLPGTVTLAQYSNFYCNNLIFKSGPAGTARLDELPVDGSGNAEVQIQGQQTVERYIPNNNFRSWRLLSVPTHGSGQTIRQAWQEGDANPLPQQNYLPGYGTQITGTGNRTAAQAAGFDNVAANAAMLYWNVNAWSPVTNTNTAIDNKQAYFLYIRGERSKGVSGSVTNSSSTTLRTAGSLYTGDQSTTVQANSFTLVPNLYASGIDFTGLTRTGVSNLFYIWDSKKLSGSSLGVYQTFSATNSFNCMVSGGSYVLGQPVTLIESGQAFFVQGNSTGGSIVLHESSKRNGSTGLGFRPSPAAVSKIETRLYEADGTTMRDAASIVFDNAYSNAVEEEDAPKIGNPGENFAIETSSKILAVEGRKPISDNDLIQFRMWNLKKQQYLLELAPQLLAGKGLEAYLEDDYLKTSVSLDLDKNNSIPFSADANAGSSAANRFRIVFKKASQSTDEVKPRFVIAPNPVESGSMHLQFKNQPAGTYYVRLINTAGQIVFAGAITHTGGSVTHKVVVPEAITNGHYKAAIHQPGKATETLQVLLNRK